jgi:hypothetical protein
LWEAPLRGQREIERRGGRRLGEKVSEGRRKYMGKRGGEGRENFLQSWSYVSLK